MYLHIHAHGDRMKVAQEAIRLPRSPSPRPSAAPTGLGRGSAFELDTAKLASALGYAGKVNGGVYQVSVPGPGGPHGRTPRSTPSMGVATALSFQPTGNGKAANTRRLRAHVS